MLTAARYSTSATFSATNCSFLGNFCAGGGGGQAEFRRGGAICDLRHRRPRKLFLLWQLRRRRVGFSISSRLVT